MGAIDRRPTTLTDQIDQADRVLTLAEAAATLGLSAEAVRSRLRRGTLAGVRRGGRWYVRLADRVDRVDRPPTDRDRPVADRPTVTDRIDRPDPPVAGVVNELRARLDEQGATIADLRRRLDASEAARERETAELRQLLAAAIAAGRQLPAHGVEHSAVTSQPVVPQPEPAWQRAWWRRLWRWGSA